ncbi:cell division protein SepF [Sporosarcina siberiensis]|uniref:Cell division protein SepF n=1 Tax=Sporosarcina siberiensis TaxID=1365606 RepID=A0ABW4SHD8_9BACL
MSLKNKLQNFFYLDDEEREVEAPKTSTRQQEEKTPVREQPKKMNSRRQTAPPREPSQPATVVSLQSAQKSSKVILVEPRVYAEAQDISEHLKNKRAVVVNLQRIDRDQGIRIVDFLSGTVYAIGGDIQRIGTDIFLCVPENVEVAGAISDFFEQ